ncbi:hypothetical protein [Actinomadura sp. NPDC048394]|uniref:hypothetical protein n=1 Tax=Actinomadura sp. NPDC048394 TaxID=3158223 RepID=UPI0033C9FBC4
MIATAAAHTVPYAWVEQTKPGGLIVVPWAATFHADGPLAVSGSTSPARSPAERNARARPGFYRFFIKSGVDSAAAAISRAAPL